MITVTVHKQRNFPISTKKIREAAVKTFTDNGISSDAESSVALVSKAKMQEYVDEYYGNDGVDHPVLSFPHAETEGEFVMPPDNILHLGEIIVSYDFCVAESKKTGRLIDEIVLEMVAHGALHLMGIHHDD